MGSGLCSPGALRFSLGPEALAAPARWSLNAEQLCRQLCAAPGPHSMWVWPWGGCRHLCAAARDRPRCSLTAHCFLPQDLVNIEMFLTAKEVEESLERRETATCLAWCHDNKSRLRKMKVCDCTCAGLWGGAAPLLGPKHLPWWLRIVWF